MIQFPRSSSSDFAGRTTPSVTATPGQSARLRTSHRCVPEKVCGTASTTQDQTNFDALPDSGFVRLSELVIIFSCSKATIWRWVKASRFPPPKKLGPRITVWNVAEIRKVLAACMNGGNHDR